MSTEALGKRRIARRRFFSNGCTFLECRPEGKNRLIGWEREVLLGGFLVLFLGNLLLCNHWGGSD